MLVKNLATNLADPSFQPTDHEERMAQEGRNRYLRRQTELAERGAAAERDDYASVIRRSLLGVAEQIAEAVRRDTSRRGTKRSGLLLKVEAIEKGNEGFEGVTTAYIALSTLFNCLNDHDKVKSDKAKIATRIGVFLQNEYNFGLVKDQNPEAWSRLVRYAKERGSERHKTRFVLNTVKANNEKLANNVVVLGWSKPIEIEEWSTKDQTFLGKWLLGLLEEAELITTITTVVGDRRQSEVVLQDHVLAWMEEFRAQAHEGSLPMITPLLAPMTEPPLPWSNPRNGGYRKFRFSLVKPGSLADFDNADMSRVYRAVNLMQATAWRIHPGMLALVERLWADGHKVGKLPRCKQREMPERIAPEVWESMPQEERKGRSLELSDIRKENRKAASNLVSINMVVTQARRLRDEPTIYMPYQLDYRGRVYCQSLLSPQGPGYVRCLLEFANGKPVGERGAMWIAIQAASLWDGEFRGKRLSKASFQDRYDWAVENEAMLRSVVSDPLGDQTWVKADKPLMFLRTAIDWVEFLDQGESFVSHLPIALDGSCSGIQHYSAILRDAETGARVNLLPSETPADVYGDVAAMIIPQVEADDCDEALFWKEHGISRKVVKKPVMTYGYSSREAGFTDWYEFHFVRPTLKAQGRRDVPSNPIARYLAKHTLDAVTECLPSVAAGMEWLMTCVRLLAHEGKGISWTAPSGFPVVQRCVSVPSVRVETMLGGERLRVSIPGASKTISKEKQKNAISPNHTHSLDAAHLVLTVLQANDYGVNDFCLIHDSFGTLAADTDAMFSATRDAFVAMYEQNDPFQHLYEQVHEALSEAGREKLPLPPAKGTLDLSQVQQSLYAFA